MATIVRLTLEDVPGGTDRWPAIASGVAAWAHANDVLLRDACLLVPFAQLLPEARRAFARLGGWMPRIETTKTLAAGLGPSVPAQVGQISFDATIDALSAAALLRSQAWGAAWARRDSRGFEQAVGALVQTAHELARAVAAVAPADRSDHWVQARQTLAPVSGPGATERLLARVALEWASLAPAPASDRLFRFGPPSAWIAVQAAAPDPVVARLMAAAAVPCLCVDTDPPEHDPFIDIGSNCVPAFAVCDGFEHEAQCAAAQVLAHVQRGECPVALVAQDRVLVRRVRALLDRQQLSLLDETGWKLSTTRAAAQVMALLHAARTDATTDALLDWLKTGTIWAVCESGGALSALEGACRRGQIARVAALDRTALDAAPARLWASASKVLSGLSESRRQSLPAWLASLSAALESCGALATLQNDDAGKQVVATLRLTPDFASANAWMLGASQVAMDLDEFRSWVDSALEEATFLPTATFDDTAQVVVTPMAGAMLRPFAAIVFPGADNRHLGALPAPRALLSDAVAGTLGLPDQAHRRMQELLSFVQVLSAPRVTFTRRRVDGNEPLSDSPLIESLAMALALHRKAFTAWHDPRIDLPIESTPIRMSAPAAANLLPARLSASACEALRACPYRFFALHMLRLREDDELEREIEKRDYGTWLHAVLLAFHESREQPAAAEIETARLVALAAESRETQGVADADFLPFAASFASFAPRYVAWLHRRDVQGARWLRGEDDLSVRPDELAGTELYGFVDRIDEMATDAGDAVQLIDYKTGSASGLRDKVRQPLEDTQLAFYAALMRPRTELPLKAMYLALDGTKGLEEIEHPEVETSAAALVDGLARDLARLRAGSGLPALGVGATCEFCAARGVCRRDHWVEDPVSPRP